jgi:hypothetical protein
MPTLPLQFVTVLATSDLFDADRFDPAAWSAVSVFATLKSA